MQSTLSTNKRSEERTSITNNSFKNKTQMDMEQHHNETKDITEQNLAEKNKTK